MRLCFALLFLVATACTSQPPPASPVPPATAVTERVQALLAAYGRRDVDAVIALCDRDQLTVYGSDRSEIVRGEAGLRELMSDDFALWGSARFGEPRDVEIRQEGALAAVLFDVPFQAGGGPEVIVRMTTVWHLRGGAWLLTASSNVVPTVGSSARELLHR